MGMDCSSGVIRALKSKDDLKENETLFCLGEKVEVKDCLFEVIAVYADPCNEITLKGLPKK